jgi:hypothetical protein
MKLSQLIAELQEQAKTCELCADTDPEVMLLIGGHKPDEAETRDITNVWAFGQDEVVHLVADYDEPEMLVAKSRVRSVMVID